MFISFFKRIFGFSKSESIRILMYHSVYPKSMDIQNVLTVTSENLEEQLKYIKKKYNTLFFKELENNKSLKNKLILTFDDGYYNNLQYLIPLLEKYQLKATICIPTDYIQKNEGNTERNFMSFNEIKSLNPEFVEIALHSHFHKNYSQLTLAEAEADIRQNIEILEQKQIDFTKILVYPYGKFPKENQKKKEFFKILESLGIIAALRIGNAVESYPWKNKFEVKRIDIKGGDSFKMFKMKLKLGKIKL
ncbi:hypothetical protein ASG22_18875 [Chryseobacterium sp. Leaf405]|uniref:polysaccharide deacetylase family protein n=1 Tax=Chryseobacterium sp. Leaf405 TaxID=1736367 RepID=UPI0006FE59D1|nr:polysaccharide deacetylase family protein [Chryseobacterium sp. Leaf405]KQT31099.1 hypothetical protein ASG22_18875 [Chryseobacterium sp. Leaf405]